MPVKHIVGNIPENITFVYSNKKKLESYWENDALHAGWEGQEVTPAFCSDSANAKTLETGRSWASRKWRHDDPTPQVCEYPHKNDPIVGLKVVSLEHRGEGGRAYKVLTPDNYYFDVREDVLMDTMLEVGISGGGILNGSFVWARVGSEMKLVRVGSKLHDALLVATADRQLKKIRYGDLQVGHIYAGKGADKFIFLGYVDTIFCEREEIRSGYGGWSWGNSRNEPRQYTRTSREIKNGILLCKVVDYVKDNKHICEDNLYHLEIKTTHSYIKDIGTIDVPSDIISRVNSWANQYIISHSKDEHISRNYGAKNLQDYEDEYFSYRSSLLLAVPTGTPLVVSDKWKDYLARYSLAKATKK